MTNKKSTRRMLLASALSVVMCAAMLVSATFAWFTDSVQSSNNTIAAGNLNIDLLVRDESGAYTSVKETKAPIFNYNKWEPGYIAYKNVKVSTTGSLSLKYTLKFALQGEISKLADVIDVYYSAKEILPNNDRALTGLKKIGTLRDVLEGKPGTVLNDTLIPGKNTEDFATIALKMRNDAGNEYQGLSIGAFDLQILATQYTEETDGFGNNDYDANAPYVLPDGVTEESFTEHAALAYADGVYYEKVSDAIAKGGTVYLKPDSVTNLKNAHTSIPGNGITIYANGATFNSDLSIDTYDYSAQGQTDGIYDGIDVVNITVYDAKNLYLWGQRNSNATVNIRMVDCVNVGKGAEKNAGRTVYLTNAKGTTNILLENAVISRTDSPVYSNANGKIELRNCEFTDCAVPVNINYKSISGKQEVVIDGCSFVECGTDQSYNYGDGTMGDYAAPIRVVHSVPGAEHTVVVRNTSVTETKGGNGDVLIAIHKGGTQAVTAVLENNLTDLRVDNGTKSFVVVPAGTKATVSAK